MFKRTTKLLWHPDAPGDTVWVTRTALGWFFRDSDFATLGECK
jgi:hypothetical protein